MFRIFFENLQEIHDISRVCFFKVPTQGLRMKKPYDLSSLQSRMHTIKITFGTKKENNLILQQNNVPKIISISRVLHTSKGQSAILTAPSPEKY